MSLSKKIRFEVFKRDGFQCAYCGKTPPEISLEVDHIEPKSKGGSDEMNNLITACFDCNRGKTNIELDKIPNQLQDNIDILKEKEEQLTAYREFIISIRERISEDVKKVSDIYKIYFKEDYEYNKKYDISIKQFLTILDLYTVIDSMELACMKKDDSIDAFKYFCGICWNKIKVVKNG